MLEVVKRTVVHSQNVVIFKLEETGMYVKEVDEFSNPISFTRDVNDALDYPNTLNFKGSNKYRKLLEIPGIKPVNRVNTTEYVTSIEE